MLRERQPVPIVETGAGVKLPRTPLEVLEGDTLPLRILDRRAAYFGLQGEGRVAYAAKNPTRTFMPVDKGREFLPMRTPPKGQFRLDHLRCSRLPQPAHILRWKDHSVIRQLGWVRVVGATGIEPVTPTMSR